MKTIELRNVSKIAQGKRLLKHISLSVDLGQIYGLIGSEHSRKSLLIKTMLGLSKITEGQVRFYDEKYRTLHKSSIGVVIGDISFYQYMTGRENILYYLANFRSDYSNDLEYYFSMFNLTSDIDRPVKFYSLGMLQKLRLIRALIIDPRILILDDPVKSLDPIAINAFKTELKRRSKRGVTIFIATSNLDFLSDLANNIGVLHYGELIDEINTFERQRDQQAYLEVHSNDLPQLILVLERQLMIYDYEVMDDKIIRILDKLDNALIVKTLVENKIDIKQVKHGFVSLEDFFLTKVGD